jgi:hypothetical protein
MDGVEPGSDLPQTGRSLFDYLVTSKGGGKGGNGRHDVVFPFTALVKKIERQIEMGRCVGARPCIPRAKIVLMPINRSLQRNAALGDFFRYPRVVLGVDSESFFQADRADLYLKDRLFLGYQEKSGVIEVISYNEAAGRFEFQIVRDYRAGGSREVVYANRALCTTCHQNQGPIFSRPLWDETQANPKIAARLEAEGPSFYPIPIRQGIDIPNALDEATDRANLLSVYQALWQEGCEVMGSSEQSIDCRAHLTTLLLQYRLGSSGANLSARPEMAPFASRFTKQLRAKWPGGIFIPNPDIPNRNPFDSLEPGKREHKTPASFFEPSRLRDPIAHWPTSDGPEMMDRLIVGLAEFLATADIERLDAALFQQNQKSEEKTTRYTAKCLFSPRWQQGTMERLLIQCNRSGRADNFSMEGVIYFNFGRVTGTLDHLSLGEGRPLTNLGVVGATVYNRKQSLSGRFGLVQKTVPLHARLADGRAITEIAFEMEMGKESGLATLTVKDDFSAVHQAIDKIAEENRSQQSDLFARQPFRRAAVMNAIFEKLNIQNPIGCCLDDTKMPPAVSGHHFREQNNQKGDREKEKDVSPMAAFHRYCDACHHEQDPFPPNFLHGSEEQVEANMRQCAERIFFRLEMGQRPFDQRAHTPMPPEIALKRRHLSPKQWAAHPDLKVMKQYITSLRTSSGRPAFEPEKLVLQEYDALPDCLAKGSALIQRAPGRAPLRGKNRENHYEH